MTTTATEEKKFLSVPMANLVHGAIFDKRNLQTPFSRVVAAVTKVDPEFGALLEGGKGYTLIVDPITLQMVREREEQYNQPPAQPQYQRQPHTLLGGYGAHPYGCASGFAIIPNGQDRAIVIGLRPDMAPNFDVSNWGQPITPGQMIAIQFDQMIGRVLGDVATVERGFVAE
jgi:hypothetical protein